MKNLVFLLLFWPILGAGKTKPPCAIESLTAVEAIAEVNDQKSILKISSNFENRSSVEDDGLVVYEFDVKRDSNKNSAVIYQVKLRPEDQNPRACMVVSLHAVEVDGVPFRY